MHEYDHLYSNTENFFKTQTYESSCLIDISPEIYQYFKTSQCEVNTRMEECPPPQ